MPIPALLIAGAKYGPGVYAAIKSMLAKNKDVNWDDMQRWLASLHAEGSLSPEDVAAAERTRSTLTQQAEETGRGQEAVMQNRLRQRGLADSAAAETSLSRIAATVARARQAAGDAAEEQKYNVWLGNKQFQQGLLSQLAGAKMGAASDAAARVRAQNAELSNAAVGFVGDAFAGGLGAGGGAKTDGGGVIGGIKDAATLAGGAATTAGTIARVKKFDQASGRFIMPSARAAASRLGRPAYRFQRPATVSF